MRIVDAYRRRGPKYSGVEARDKPQFCRITSRRAYADDPDDGTDEHGAWREAC
jgi:hypothetical protein